MEPTLKELFDEVWLVDFEFSAPPGESPSVVCMVAREFFTGKTLRYWRDELLLMRQPPFRIDERVLFVAYYAVAEVSCFLTLGWTVPVRILDLFTEFRCLTNGLSPHGGNGLVGALQYFSLPSIDVTEKESMRTLAIRGGSYTEEEQRSLLEYCESDVLALDKLLPAMLLELDLYRALLRGKYMAAIAAIERNGIPLDAPLLQTLRANWGQLQNLLVAKVDSQYGVYEGRTFKADKFAEYLSRRGIPWPVLPSGKLDLKDDTFKDMAKIYPELQSLRELRVTLSRMRLSEFPVGSDGRNRCLLSPFSAKTGRNQPSTSKFIFGPATWMRGLIKPPEGHGVAYIDWSQQEFGIAAALSGDPLMMEAYRSGDPYLEFAKQAGAAPPEATKKSHQQVREQFKACALGVNYGMGAESLADRIKRPPCEARLLLDLHRRTYSRYWQWADDVVNAGMMHSRIFTVFGWEQHVGPDANPRSLRNFPMQGNGAEMLRLACIYGIAQGIKICAPVHDAVLIEAPVEVLDDHIARMQEAMRRASREVLGGFELRSDAKEVIYPDRYMDERGSEMWRAMLEALEELTCLNLTEVPEAV